MGLLDTVSNLVQVSTPEETEDNMMNLVRANKELELGGLASTEMFEALNMYAQQLGLESLDEESIQTKVIVDNLTRLSMYRESYKEKESTKAMISMLYNLHNIDEMYEPFVQLINKNKRFLELVKKEKLNLITSKVEVNYIEEMISEEFYFESTVCDIKLNSYEAVKLQRFKSQIEDSLHNVDYIFETKDFAKREVIEPEEISENLPWRDTLEDDDGVVDELLVQDVLEIMEEKDIDDIISFSTDNVTKEDLPWY